MLRDGQTYHDPCPCLDSNQHRTWVISLGSTCPELTTDISFGGDVFRVNSYALTNVFVTLTARCLKGDNELDRFELDTAVEKMITSVNGPQGFTIQGWFKPAIDEEGVAVENINSTIVASRQQVPFQWSS